MTHGYRIKGKHKRLVPADSATPHNCVILAVDPATTSGWCIAIEGLYYSSGEADEGAFGEPVRLALACAELRCSPCVLLLEKPFARNPEVVATLYRVRRAWFAAWKLHGQGLGHSGKRVDVAVPTWRSRVLGATSGVFLPPLEAAAAHDVAGLHPSGVRGPDENAAICIAKWGSTAGEVAKVIPKRFWGASIG